MNSRELIPEPEVVGKQLEAEIEYLTNQNHTIHDADHTGILYTQLEELEGIDFESENWEFSLEPNWMVQLSESSDNPIDERGDFAGAEAWGAIGGNLCVQDGEFDNYAFSLAILVQEDSERIGDNESVNCPCCWDDGSNWADREEEVYNRWRVARRFHFDIDLGRNDHEAKPISHLQIGGRFQEHQVNTIAESNMDTHYCLSPLNKPRIPHPPMDPGLIYTMLLSQYSYPRRQVEEDWYTISRGIEKNLCDPYYEKLGSHYREGLISNPFPFIISNNN